MSSRLVTLQIGGKIADANDLEMLCRSLAEEAAIGLCAPMFRHRYSPPEKWREHFEQSSLAARALVATLRSVAVDSFTTERLLRHFRLPFSRQVFADAGISGGPPVSCFNFNGAKAASGSYFADGRLGLDAAQLRKDLRADKSGEILEYIDVLLNPIEPIKLPVKPAMSVTIKRPPAPVTDAQPAAEEATSLSHRP